MPEEMTPTVAIVDYGMGNLFSVKHACEQVGLRAVVSSLPVEILDADAVVIPGVGAFGDAMTTLGKLDLIEPLRDVASSGRPLLGVCLGFQLLMTESEEFGLHQGLGVIAGSVVALKHPMGADGRLKVPQVGWNRLTRPLSDPVGSWEGTFLEGLEDGVYFHFAHSYFVQPVDAATVIATTTYGDITFASCVQRGNVFGCQAHPERSGRDGLKVYRNLLDRVSATSPRFKEHSVSNG